MDTYMCSTSLVQLCELEIAAWLLLYSQSIQIIFIFHSQAHEYCLLLSGIVDLIMIYGAL